MKGKGKKGASLLLKIISHEDTTMIVGGIPKGSEVKVKRKIVDHTDVPMIIGNTDVPMIIGHEDVIFLTLKEDPKNPVQFSIKAKIKK